MADTVRQKVFSGTLWLMGVSFAQQILQFVVQIVLARLLVPNDYGTAALVMTIGSFAVVLSSAGIGAAIVQRKEMPRSILDAAAVITGALAIVLSSILFFSAPLVSRLLGVGALSLLLKIVSVDIFLKVMLSLYDSIMLREMMYKSLALRSFIGLLVQSTVSIVLAFLAAGPMSLVIGYVSGSFSQLVLCYLATRYFPRSLGDISAVGGVFKFGAWVLAGKVSNQLAITIDQMIVARLLNVATLGLYNVARTLTGIVPNMFLHIVGRMTLPVFSRHQDDMKWIEENYWRGIRLNLMVVLPICVLVGVFSYQILSLLYGSKWLAAAPVMRVCAIIVAVFAIDSGYSATVYQAVGKPQYGMILLLLSLPVLPLFVYLGSHWGVMGYAWSIAVFSVACLIITLTILHRRFHFRVQSIVMIIVRASVSVMPISVAAILCTLLFFDKTTPPAVFSLSWFAMSLRLLGCVILCLVVYILTVRIFMRDDFAFLKNGVAAVLIKRKRGLS